jgi:uncharacterized membrane protein
MSLLQQDVQRIVQTHIYRDTNKFNNSVVEKLNGSALSMNKTTSNQSNTIYIFLIHIKNINIFMSK